MLQPSQSIPLLDAFRADAAAFAAAFHPWSRLRCVMLVYEDGQQVPVPVLPGAGIPIVNPNVGAAIAPSGSTHPDLPALTPLQRRIILAIAEHGPQKGNTLAQNCELGNRSSLYGAKGVTGLLQAGLVENDAETGYRLTPFGCDVAEELGGDDEQD